MALRITKQGGGSTRNLPLLPKSTQGSCRNLDKDELVEDWKNINGFTGYLTKKWGEPIHKRIEAPSNKLNEIMKLNSVTFLVEKNREKKKKG